MTQPAPRIYLIRHGESAANAGEATDLPNTIPLTALGHQQAQALAQQFPEPPTLVVTSPFLRTYQTAAPTLARFPTARHEVWPVQEFTYLSPVSCIGTTAAARQPRARDYRERNDPDYVDGEGAESFVMLLQRTHAMLERLRHETGVVAVFTHGQMIRATQLLRENPQASAATLMRQFHTTPAIPNAAVIPLSSPHDKALG